MPCDCVIILCRVVDEPMEEESAEDEPTATAKVEDDRPAGKVILFCHIFCDCIPSTSMAVPLCASVTEFELSMSSQR